MCNIYNKAIKTVIFSIFIHSLPFLHYIVQMIMQNTIFIYIQNKHYIFIILFSFILNLRKTYKQDC